MGQRLLRVITLVILFTSFIFLVTALVYMSCTKRKSPLFKAYGLSKDTSSFVDNCPNGFDVCRHEKDVFDMQYTLCLPKTYNKADYCHDVIGVIPPQKTEPRYKLVRSRVAECIPPWPPGCLCGSAAISVHQNTQYVFWLMCVPPSRSSLGLP